ncbi:MAG TPA: YdbL family protein [Steroidobacteraceae bacterium]
MRRTALKLVALCMCLSACVTINVYFPAAAAEKAADRIIEDVWGEDARKSQSDKRTQLFEADPRRVLLAVAGAVLDLLVPAAHAQQADLNISTPVIKQITQAMEDRHAKLKQYYESGAIGLTRDGLVEIRDQNLIPLPERNSARKLVADENADRANLYREIANANGHPEWEMDIRRTFAERWIERASPGWYVQDQKGQWTKK